MPVSRRTQRSELFPVADVAFSRTLLLATDVQKSTLCVLDRNGPRHLAYSAYGLQSGPLAPGTQLGFNGQLKECTTDWYHLGNGHRVYNPTLMRFHSPDRLSPFEKGGLNTYAYCVGDPVNFEDPTGQFISAIIRLIETFETMAGHVENIATALFRSRPRGVLGYASMTSNVGYAGMTTGAGLQAAGYPVGGVVLNVSAGLVSASNGVKAAHSVVQVLKSTRVARAFVGRSAIKIPTVQELHQVVVEPSPSTAGRIRIPMPPHPNSQSDARKIRNE